MFLAIAQESTSPKSCTKLCFVSFYVSRDVKDFSSERVAAPVDDVEEDEGDGEDDATDDVHPLRAGRCFSKRRHCTLDHSAVFIIESISFS